MKIKTLLGSTLALTLIVGSAYAANQDPEIPEKVKNEKVQQVPDIKYKANDHVPKEKLIDINKKINKENIKANKGELKAAKLMTYKQFADKLNNGDYNAAVDPKRQVWVVQIDYPEGYEHNQAGFIANCVTVTVYDAETGEWLGSHLSEKKHAPNFSEDQETQQ